MFLHRLIKAVKTTFQKELLLLSNVYFHKTTQVLTHCIQLFAIEKQKICFTSVIGTLNEPKQIRNAKLNENKKCLKEKNINQRI